MKTVKTYFVQNQISPVSSHIINQFIPLSLLICPIRRIYMARHNTAMPPHLLLLTLDENLRPLLCNSFFVLEYEQGGVTCEEAIDVLEGAAGCFRIEEIDCWVVRDVIMQAPGWLTYRNEGEVEDGPDYVEPPLKASDSGRSDFDDCAIYQYVRCITYVEYRPMKLKIQFVAVPRAAPLVRIAIELISVG